MVENLAENGKCLELDLDWLARLLETRIKLYFGQESHFSRLEEITPPDLTGVDTPYARFVRDLNLGFAERALLVLALTPHIRPHLLDLFFTQNAESGRFFTEFGGRNGHPHQPFLPTGETALFVLAGDDLGKRLHYSRLFDADHPFALNHIVTLEQVQEGEPAMSGILALSREALDLVTLGEEREPAFGTSFPARKIVTEMGWEDLILDPYTMEQVLDIKTWIDHGKTLLYDLGLAKRLKPGYRALFHGPPGTGKTLTASLLGKTTGLDAYRIDLSMVVSKYIGETEKNLEKVFSRAENREWILFFDEADALFGKRTDVRDAHDRYANQEVSYLLQRVEEYPGVVILASNRLSNLDEAFTRRFHSIIHFPVPGKNERLALWRSGFSNVLGPEKDVNIPEIAARYELSGGAIANAIRYATLVSLKKGTSSVLTEDIEEGIRKELQKEGRTF
ncbi:MAG: ATP-dependent zinc metalloprotease FtsH 2 [Syntrophorhabdaceae bacterium PtaU1.Bin034]|nr:MAG: ATP-dependent zinc metalloprotease FtsH 2 [Syntrophorhabdaceae bacterium PtaU1.Bin034]